MEHEFTFFDDDSQETQQEFENEFENLEELEPGEERVLKVRLDKWLWAARFFKTRALARAAVEAGKVFYNSERSKPSREIEIGATLYIRQGRFEKTVIVRGLSTRRRSTEEALQLFEETENSKNAREAQSSYMQPPMEGTGDHYYAQHNTSNTGYYPQEQRERRSTRFLRRSFVRQSTGNVRTDQENEQQPYEERYEQQPYEQRNSQPYEPRNNPPYEQRNNQRYDQRFDQRNDQRFQSPYEPRHEQKYGQRVDSSYGQPRQHDQRYDQPYRQPRHYDSRHDQKPYGQQPRQHQHQHDQRYDQYGQPRQHDQRYPQRYDQQHRQPQYGQRHDQHYGQSQYGQSGQSQYGQSQYGQSPYGQRYNEQYEQKRYAERQEHRNERFDPRNDPRSSITRQSMQEKDFETPETSETSD